MDSSRLQEEPGFRSQQSRAHLESDEEKRLVNAAIGRDQAAFASLYDLYVVRVYRYILYLVGDVSDTEDLTAQTFLKAWEAIDRYTDRGFPITAWLLRIAHNLAVSYLRSRRSHAALDTHFVRQLPGGDPNDAAEQTSDEESVRAAVRLLKGDQRQVIMLRFVEEMDYRQVAQVMDKSVPAIRVIQHRALANLRKLLREL